VLVEPLAFPLSLAGFLAASGFASELVPPSPLEGLPLSVPEPAAAAPSEPEPDPLSADADAAFEAEREAELRSFLAQPLPLKWTVGAEKAFRTGEAPQIGHAVGPSPVTEWMTSKRWPFGQR
jgi:hypothetical protein